MKDPSEAPASRAASNGSGKALNWLLVLPLVALLVPSFYNFREPTLIGVPFFYWYQILWVVLTAGITWYLFRRGEAEP